MTESVYIHIPFCKSKCRYCSFVSITDTEMMESYVKALLQEIKKHYNSENLKTLYFGGGTPSLLPIDLVAKILKEFNFSKDTEVTFEINPDDANFTYLKELKNLGVNRLSFGVQTFDDDILKLIGRRHSSKDVLKAVDNTHNAGFENISVDLIYGLPTQTMNILKNDLEAVKTLNIQHVSTYGLKIEPPSYFYNNPVKIPDDDTQADMYLGVNDFLENIGYKRYEISNFSKSGYESKHNLNYWNNLEYYGFGVAAHGYKDGIRYSNTSGIEKYIANPLKHENEHIVSTKEKLEEEIFLGFRKETGIDVTSINKNFNINFQEKYKDIIKKYSPKYLVKTNSGYKLTLDGVLLSNNILAEFID